MWAIRSLGELSGARPHSLNMCMAQGTHRPQGVCEFTDAIWWLGWPIDKWLRMPTVHGLWVPHAVIVH